MIKILTKQKKAREKIRKILIGVMITGIVIGTQPINANAASHTISNKKINTIYKHNKKAHPNISKYKIERAAITAKNRSSKKTSTSEYKKKVALILATMEVESNFKMINHRNNNGSIDYGIMQVNSSMIPTIRKVMGSKIANGLKYNISDNIEAGSYEIITLCYNKAKQKHPNNVIWWTYAYYNRGLYFENYSYNYKQANTRSQKFIKVYKRYLKDL